MTLMNSHGKPCCPKCKASIGWTRLIRRRHKGQPILCFTCSIADLIR